MKDFLDKLFLFYLQLILYSLQNLFHLDEIDIFEYNIPSYLLFKNNKKKNF